MQARGKCFHSGASSFRKHLSACCEVVLCGSSMSDLAATHWWTHGRGCVAVVWGVVFEALALCKQLPLAFSSH